MPMFSNTLGRISQFIRAMTGASATPPPAPQPPVGVLASGTWDDAALLDDTQIWRDN